MTQQQDQDYGSAIERALPIGCKGFEPAKVLDNGNLHPDTSDLVDRFSLALSMKLMRAQTKYGYNNGWMDAGWMDECRKKLMEHIEKGDPLDVAAYCAFLWHHKQPTLKPGNSKGVDTQKHAPDAPDAGDAGVKQAESSTGFEATVKESLAVQKQSIEDEVQSVYAEYFAPYAGSTPIPAGAVMGYHLAIAALIRRERERGDFAVISKELAVKDAETWLVTLTDANGEIARLKAELQTEHERAEKWSRRAVDLSAEHVEASKEIDRLKAELQTEREQAETLPAEIIKERDDWEIRATNLAELVGNRFGEDVGEWSSANDPVANAEELLSADIEVHDIYIQKTHEQQEEIDRLKARIAELEGGAR